MKKALVVEVLNQQNIALPRFGKTVSVPVIASRIVLPHHQGYPENHTVGQMMQRYQHAVLKGLAKLEPHQRERLLKPFKVQSPKDLATDNIYQAVVKRYGSRVPSTLRDIFSRDVAQEMMVHHFQRLFEARIHPTDHLRYQPDDLHQKAAASMFGYSAHEPLGQQLQDPFQAFDRAFVFHKPDMAALEGFTNRAKSRLVGSGILHQAINYYGWLCHSLSVEDHLPQHILGRQEEKIPRYNSVFPEQAYRIAPCRKASPIALEGITPNETDILIAQQILEKYGNRLRKHPLFAEKGPVTPLARSNYYSHVVYKREDLTAIGAYKLRGAVVTMHRAMYPMQKEVPAARSFVAVSTGNHALGVLRAAQLLRPESVRIVIPHTTDRTKRDMLETKIQELKGIQSISGKPLKATLDVQGQTFDEAQGWLNQTKPESEFLIHPYNHPWVVSGQATIGLEVLKQIRPIVRYNKHIRDVHISCAIGGGGLLSGIALAVTQFAKKDPAFRNVQFHFHGYRISNTDPTTYGKAIAVKHVAPENLERLTKLGVNFYTISEAGMARGMKAVANDLSAKVEGSAAGSFDMLGTIIPQYNLDPKSNLYVCILSGGNITDFPK